MAESSTSDKPLTVVDRLHGESVQLGDNNKKHVFRNCIFNINHHHHHHPRCGQHCQDQSDGQVTYTRDEEEVVVEVLKNVQEVGDEVGESISAVTQGEYTDKSHDPGRASPDIPVDSVKIIDTWGCELKVGDVVGLGSVFSYLFPTAIYVGDGMIVRCDEDTGRILKEELNLRKTFYKRGVTYGRVPVYNRSERVKRAEGRVGDMFLEGHKKDFVCWCCTGVTNMKALRQVILGP